MDVAKRMNNVQMSGIRKMFEMADKNAIHLGLGEPDFQPPQHVIQALYDATLTGKNKYASTFGLMELRQALAADYSHKGRGLTADNVMITASGTEALYATIQTFISPGDEVITPNPGFVLYDSQVKLAGGVPVNYHLSNDNGFLPDPDELRSLITDRTKAIIINSPSNPTGSVIDAKLLEDIANLTREKGLLLISDEVYDRIIYDGKEHRTALEFADNCIVINSFSKTLALTGWRLGYIVASDPEIIKNISIPHYYIIACPPTPTQYAALAAHREKKKTEEFISKMLKAYTKRRDVISHRLNEITGMELVQPSGAFYVFPSFDYNITSEELALYLAKKGVICSPGTAFGRFGEGHLRFSFATSTYLIEKGMDIVVSAVKKLEAGSIP